MQLGELQSLLSKAEREKTQILAVSIDRHDDSKKLAARLQGAQKHGGGFPMLQDTDHKVIDRYGILNPDGKGWPHPSTYVIDPKGVVRWKFIETDPSKRPTNKQILQELRKIS